MITLTRRQAHGLRAVFRRHALGIAHRAPIPPLVLEADLETGLHVRFHHDLLAVEQALPVACSTVETILLPLDALAEVAGRDDSPVELEAVAPDRTVLRWADRRIPQAREHAAPNLDALPPFPAPPPRFETAPARLLDALAEAARAAGDDNARYDLRNIQLRGGASEIVAADGRQALIQRPCRLPWDDDVLVRPAPLLAGKALPRDRPIRLGRTDHHVVLQAGDLTVWLTIQQARFPRLDGVLPVDLDRASCLRLDPDDAAFLVEAIDRLPGGDLEHAPVTVDLNGQVAVRARGDDPRPTELVLDRSGYTGPPVRLCTNRAFLGRALALGLGAIHIAGAEQPVVARDAECTFAWQPLNAESALAPSDDVLRIRSGSAPSSAPASRTTFTRRPMSEPIPHNGRKADDPTSTNGSTAPNVPISLVELIREAEALHAALGQARGQTARLIAGLRGQKKRSRLVSETLRSLRQIGLAEAAE